ncbi:MAG: hypothetical protein AAF555_10045 [Verrucomicrobiota bacterium]
MELRVEVKSRYQEPEDASQLLYAPLSYEASVLQSRLYHLDFAGQLEAAQNFVRKVLVDPVSQEVGWDGRPLVAGAKFFLDYGMKAGALDLEKEAILSYYRNLTEKPFALEGLRLATRVYVFGDSVEETPFVRDICNPAIHSWSIATATA